MNALPLVLPFDGIGRSDVPAAGGKGANLGEMIRAGLPVPPGFVVTVAAYRRVLDEAGITADVDGRMAGVGDATPDELSTLADEIRATLLGAPMEGEVLARIERAYQELGGDPPVAVRSSATAEDAALHSFAGMFQSFLNVNGTDELVTRIRECWASAFSARVLHYRQRHGITGDAAVAVVVQRMVQSEKAGVLFTANPATDDRNTLVIEAAFGLGEVVVAGQVTPDRYEVDKASRRVTVRRAGHKSFRLDRDPETGHNVRLDLDDAEAAREALTDREIAELTELALRLEAHYGVPQDAEWAIEGGRVWLVQSRPVTTLGSPAGTKPVAPPDTTGGGAVLVRGLGAGPGIAAGPVRVLGGPDEEHTLQDGDVLVAPTTTPDWLAAMRRAAAIVTDAGGMTSHAAIVSRELGIPCVVGTRDGTRVLEEGTVVTVDGVTGEVRAGEAPAASEAPRSSAAGDPPPVTATRLYVNLGEPTRADEIAALPVDGVGLLRAEFMILEALDGRHPRLLLERGLGEEFVERMVEGLRTFGRAFGPRPVIYRAMDFKSNEFRGLEGGEHFEPDEANPMIGYRGCYRYTQEPDLFGLELRALARAREDFPSLHLMLPFVRTGHEFAACKRLIDASELGGDPDLELWVMAEVPSVVTWLDDYVRLGATGVSIGSNDLTQLVLGVDRDSEILAPLFDERDRAVLATIEAIIRACRRLGVTSSICGQAPSVHPDYVERLVEWGIDSVSVTPDAIDRTRRNLAAAEERRRSIPPTPGS